MHAMNIQLTSSVLESLHMLRNFAVTIQQLIVARPVLHDEGLHSTFASLALYLGHALSIICPAWSRMHAKQCICC